MLFTMDSHLLLLQISVAFVVHILDCNVCVCVGGCKHTGDCVHSSNWNTKHFAGCYGKPQRLSHGNAHHHFRGQTGGEGCGKRSVWLCVGELQRRGGEGSAEGSAWCAHITLDDSRRVQRNSSMQFVGSHNLTSSPKAGC